VHRQTIDRAASSHLTKADKSSFVIFRLSDSHQCQKKAFDNP